MKITHFFKKTTIDIYVHTHTNKYTHSMHYNCLYIFIYQHISGLQGWHMSLDSLSNESHNLSNYIQHPKYISFIHSSIQIFIKQCDELLIFSPYSGMWYRQVGELEIL